MGEKNDFQEDPGDKKGVVVNVVCKAAGRGHAGKPNGSGSKTVLSSHLCFEVHICIVKLTFVF